MPGIKHVELPRDRLGYRPLPLALMNELARKLHPDAGGDPAQWDRLDAARNLLVTAGLL